MSSNPRLDAAYAAQAKAIRARVEAFALARFAAGQHRDADLARFVSQASSVVLAGRAQTAALTDAYLTQVLRSAGLAVPAHKAVDTAALRGVAVEEVLARPFTTVRVALSEGSTYGDAIKAGAARLTDIVATDMQLSKTHAARNVFSRTGGVHGFSRVVSGGKTCALCYIAATQKYSREDLLPIHPGCVPEGSPVSAFGVVAVTRRRYTGELTIIRTASGDHVTVTPNHPVLTHQGWVPANLVCEGDDVLRYSGSHGMVGSGPHEDHRPTLIEDVWRAACVSGRLVTVPLASEDFHGDGTNGEVDVVYPNSDLAPVGGVTFGEPDRELALMSRHGRRLPLDSRGPLGAFVPSSFAASGGDVGSSGLGLALCERHATDMQDAGFSNASTFDALRLQRQFDRLTFDPIADSKAELSLTAEIFVSDLLSGKVAPSATPTRFDPAAAEFIGKGRGFHASQGRRLTDRLSGRVQFDRVVEVRRINSTSSHVYNLHTSEGWYSSNSHIVSNCSCNVEPLTDSNPWDQDAMDKQLEDTHAAVFDRLGVSDSGGRAPDYRKITVYEHGEYGPTLGRAADSHIGPGDLAT